MNISAMIFSTTLAFAIIIYQQQSKNKDNKKVNKLNIIMEVLVNVYSYVTLHIVNFCLSNMAFGLKFSNNQPGSSTCQRSRKFQRLD